MSKPVLCSLTHNMPDSGYPPWELEVFPTHSPDSDPPWKVNIDEQGVLIRVPSTGLFLHLKWDYLVRLTQETGDPWAPETPYPLTEAGAAALATFLKGDHDDPA